MEKIKKNVKKRVFYPKNKTNICKCDKNVTLFYLLLM